jgi:hypothetical protein
MSAMDEPLASICAILQLAMDLNQRKQAFSKAYVKAVAAVCGYATGEPDVDDDSVDLTLSARGGSGTIRSPKLDIQLKCTARDVLSNGNLNFPLPIKNYDELRPTDLMVPRVLVVVLVPDEIMNWVLHSEEELVLRHCGYWYSLLGMPDTDNTTTVTVGIPRTQVFDVSGLGAIMTRLTEGGLP